MFSSEIFQNYLVFIPAKKNTFKDFSGTIRIGSRKYNKIQKKILKI